MKANELRIGNLVLFPLNSNDPEMQEYEGIIHSISFDSDTGFGMVNGDTDINELKPIPLTEDRLFRFGFETGMLNTWFIIPKDTYAIISLEKKGDGFYITNLPIKLIAVHQLQNLYFALTGEELNIKDNAKTNR